MVTERSRAERVRVHRWVLWPSILVLAAVEAALLLRPSPPDLWWVFWVSLVVTGVVVWCAQALAYGVVGEDRIDWWGFWLLAVVVWSVTPIGVAIVGAVAGSAGVDLFPHLP